MAIDLKQFHQVFFDEAAEHLAEMEILLLGLDTTSPNIEDLNGIFRAVHSIKGGSGTFGFTDIAEISHASESLLDKLRKEELMLTDDMIDIFLESGDVIKNQLAAHRGEGKADKKHAMAITEKLKRLASADPTLVTETAMAPQRHPTTMQIHFSTINHAGINELLEALALCGVLDTVKKPKAKGRWHLILRTTSTEKQIRALFKKIKAKQLTIKSSSESKQNPAYGFFHDIPAQTNETDRGYGFFTEIPNPPQDSLNQTQSAPASSGNQTEATNEERGKGRRMTDEKDFVIGKAGRRLSDKQVTVTQTDLSSIRVNIEKVDQLINMVGELVITQAMLAQICSQMDPVLNEKLLNGMGLLERNTRDLQEAVMSIRMMPISFVFSRFPRMVRDLAGRLNKQAELITFGDRTELDKGLIEKIIDPLTHLVRNSIDHGIEFPQQRLQRSKDAKGMITLRASHQGSNIVIEVSDDGGGLNREKILDKAREKGMMVSDDMSDQEVWQLIYTAGFSTADQVTDVSGRGMGMDIVRKNIQNIGGRIEIESEADIGTTIIIRLPLTLAILDGMSVTVGDETYIIPLTYIRETIQPKEHDVKTISGQGKVVRVRGEYLPLIAMHEVFNTTPNIAPHYGTMVLIEAERKKVALLVDELIGQHQVVIKSLESNYRKIAGISGATIMGDGRVALIVDVAEIVRNNNNRSNLRLVA